MKIIKNTIKAIVAVTVATGLTGCDSFLKEYSQDLVKVESWSDLDEVLMGDVYLMSVMPTLSGSYFQMNNRDLDFDFIYTMSDELTPNYTYNGSNDPSGMVNAFGFRTWQRDTGTDRLGAYIGGDERYWDGCYERINVCNMVLGVIDEQPVRVPSDADEIVRVKGEASFLRALYYFTLANLYAQPYDPATAESTPGVPLKLKQFVEDIEYSRGTLKQTYDQILRDLETARECLEGKTRKNIYRADLNTANLLTARVYLYMQDWENAAKYAQTVIDAKPALTNYSTIGDPAKSVTAASPEVIFSMGDHAVGFISMDQSKPDDGYTTYFSVSDDIMSLYSDNDYRKDAFFGHTERRNNRAILKFSCQPSTYGSYHDVGSTFLFRSTEAYLILAEADAYMGKDGDSRNVLNRYVPNRIGNYSVTASGNALIDFIREERAREFIIEGGHRWFDLRRYTVNTVYPWSKVIEHFFTVYDDSYPDYNDWYRLEKNDPAYTLPIPRSVREFQPSIGNNERPNRAYFEREQF